MLSLLLPISFYSDFCSQASLKKKTLHVSDHYLYQRKLIYIFIHIRNFSKLADAGFSLNKEDRFSRSRSQSAPNVNINITDTHPDHLEVMRTLSGLSWLAIESHWEKFSLLALNPPSPLIPLAALAVIASGYRTF